MIVMGGCSYDTHGKVSETKRFESLLPSKNNSLRCILSVYNVNCGRVAGCSFTKLVFTIFDLQKDFFNHVLKR